MKTALAALVAAALAAGCGGSVAPANVDCHGKAPSYKKDDGPLRLQAGCEFRH